MGSNKPNPLPPGIDLFIKLLPGQADLLEVRGRVEGVVFGIAILGVDPGGHNLFLKRREPFGHFIPDTKRFAGKNFDLPLQLGEGGFGAVFSRLTDGGSDKAAHAVNLERTYESLLQPLVNAWQPHSVLFAQPGIVPQVFFGGVVAPLGDGPFPKTGRFVAFRADHAVVNPVNWLEVPGNPLVFGEYPQHVQQHKQLFPFVRVGGGAVVIDIFGIIFGDRFENDFQAKGQAFFKGCFARKNVVKMSLFPQKFSPLEYKPCRAYEFSLVLLLLYC